MIKINASSVNDLLSLHEVEAPVTMTSHPGNASLYKLTLWKCGMPEHLWDVTCCKADANNWPMFKLKDGESELLIEEELHRKIMREASSSKRFITAYQMTKDGERLGRFHVRVMQKLFPNVISSCSKLLLSEEAKVRDMFYYLAETRMASVFGRRINEQGEMTAFGGKVSPEDAVDSFIHLLHELEHLLFSDEPIPTLGGLCYDGVIVQLSTMLVQFWQTDRIDRYDISGPDMIHYSSRPEYQHAMSDMLKHLRRWSTTLVPKNLVVRMFPGTTARVGHIRGHISEEVMTRKKQVLQSEGRMTGDFKRRLWEIAKDDEKNWPIAIRPNIDHYFSQHDLINFGHSFEVDDFWREIPFDVLWGTLSRANALLRVK